MEFNLTAAGIAIKKMFQIFEFLRTKYTDEKAIQLINQSEAACLVAQRESGKIYFEYESLKLEMARIAGEKSSLVKQHSEHIARLEATTAEKIAAIDRKCREEIAKLDGSNLTPEELDVLRTLNAIGDLQTIENIRANSKFKLDLSRLNLVMKRLEITKHVIEMGTGYRMLEKGINVLYNSPE